MLPNSKKIKKNLSQPKKCYSLEDENTVVKAKMYRIYQKSQKMNFVMGLRSACKLHSGGKDLSSDELVGYLETINTIEYNHIIENLLALHAPSVLEKKQAEKIKELKQWRRQLKSWVKNIDKPEIRGKAQVVPAEKTDEFKQRITQIITSLPKRSFNLLRKEALCILEDMHNTGINNPEQPFNKNTFSKHFWHDFKRLHPEIKELYGSLPPVLNKRSGYRNTGNLCFDTFDGNDEDSDGKIGEELDQENLSLSSTDYTTSPFQSEIEIFIEEGQSPELENQISFEGAKVMDDMILNFDLNESDHEIFKYGFSPLRKMIVEPEENEAQKFFFRNFCLNGI